MPILPHAVYVVFTFALGACVGSFLNVVVWRLPRVELPEKSNPLKDFWLSASALSNPPSHCPNCNHRLLWYDNLPIVGWLKLGGKCRFCKQPFSIRYPVVELATALIFAGYYVAYFLLQWRAICPDPHVAGVTYTADGFRQILYHTEWAIGQSWPVYGLYMALLSGLLAASLIDAELYIIPLEIPWLLAGAGVLVHTLGDRPDLPGSVNLVGPYGAIFTALSAGATLGFVASLLLWFGGIMPTSFPDGEPMLDADRARIEAEDKAARERGEPVDQTPLPPAATPGKIRREIAKEMLFLTPALGLGGAAVAAVHYSAAAATLWRPIGSEPYVNGFLGATLGALVGAAVVWVVRILGTLVFRRVAMGLGDVHLMFGVGAIVGAGGATAAFFLAPLFGILVAVYRLLTRRGREIPFGPYLSLATAVVMLSYRPISLYFGPGLQGLLLLLGDGGSGLAPHGGSL